jgi:hypothetical protein
MRTLLQPGLELYQSKSIYAQRRSIPESNDSMSEDGLSGVEEDEEEEMERLKRLPADERKRAIR